MLGAASTLKFAVTSGCTADPEVATATANESGPRVQSVDNWAPPVAAKEVDVAGAGADVGGGVERGLLPPVDTNAPSTAAAPSAAVPTTAIGRIRRRRRTGRGAARRLADVPLGGDEKGGGGEEGGGGVRESEGGSGRGATGTGATGGGNGATRSPCDAGDDPKATR